MKFILNRKLKFYTLKVTKLLCLSIIAVVIIGIIILIKYKPMYEVELSDEKIGYIESKEAFEESIKNEILNASDKNVDSTIIKEKPQYELKFVDRQEETNETKILEKIKEESETTYKFYEIALSNVTVDSVDTLEDAKKIVEEVKQEDNNMDLDLSISEKYTDKKEEIKTNDIETAKENISSKVAQEIVEEQKQKEEQERINAMPVVEGIKLATLPVSGTITSRYGESSSLRKSTHTGLDIACSTGTPIKAVSDGTIIFASYSGSYGNLVKVDHGNGVETWYGHTSKMYVTVGQKVSAGDIIAAVGSTGNSTGSHLHLEIRINGNTINPQKYLYN